MAVFTVQKFSDTSLTTPNGATTLSEFDYSDPGEQTSAKITGGVKFLYSELYTISVFVNDGARFWLDGVLKLDAWFTSIGSTYTFTHQAQAGSSLPIIAEYLNTGPTGVLTVRWQSASQALQIIPASTLQLNTTSRVTKTITLAQHWQDTGFVLAAGERMKATVTGEVRYAFAKFAYPEGSYANGFKRVGVEDIAATQSYAQIGRPANSFVVTNTIPYSVALVVMPEGVTPSSAIGAISNGLRPNRMTTFAPAVTGGRVWAIFNDNKYSDNEMAGILTLANIRDLISKQTSGTQSGQAFYLTLEKIETPTTAIDPGKPSPLRFIPPGILEIKRSSEQTLAWCLAVKAKRGWEGHTGWNIPLSLPAYTDGRGNFIPAMTYYPNGASTSNLSLEIKLGVKSTDLKLFAPRYDGYALPTPNLNLSRERIYKGEYEGAEWEMFEVAPYGNLSERLVWQAGHVGNVGLDDIMATVELIGWDDVPNRVIGDIFHIMCQVGNRPVINGVKERFGNGRCRNSVLNDGPLRDNWTVEATLMNPISYDTLRLSYGNVAKSGAVLPLPFPNRLAAGDVSFFAGAAGGRNDAFEIGIKRGIVVSAGVVDVVLRLSLPSLPAVGDKLWLSAGCLKTKDACLGYNNLINMRAQDLPGQDDLNRRSLS